MKKVLYEDGSALCDVQIIRCNPPTRQGGRLIPGTIILDSPRPLNIDGKYSIDINQKMMKIELTRTNNKVSVENGTSYTA